MLACWPTIASLHRFKFVDVAIVDEAVDEADDSSDGEQFVFNGP